MGGADCRVLLEEEGRRREPVVRRMERELEHRRVPVEVVHHKGRQGVVPRRAVEEQGSRRERPGEEDNSRLGVVAEEDRASVLVVDIVLQEVAAGSTPVRLLAVLVLLLVVYFCVSLHS